MVLFYTPEAWRFYPYKPDQRVLSPARFGDLPIAACGYVGMTVGLLLRTLRNCEGVDRRPYSSFCFSVSFLAVLRQLRSETDQSFSL